MTTGWSVAVRFAIAGQSPMLSGTREFVSLCCRGRGVVLVPRSGTGGRARVPRERSLVQLYERSENLFEKVVSGGVRGTMCPRWLVYF